MPRRDAYLIRAQCGDYYCGCGGGHVLGVALTEADAELLAAEARTSHRTLTSSTRGEIDMGLWDYVEIEKFPVGTLLNEPERV